MLNSIVKQINDDLAKNLFSKSQRFVGFKLYGLAEYVPKAMQQGEVTYPEIIPLDGDGTYVGIEDTQSLIAYHRKQTFDISTETIQGYGDRPAASVYTYGMSVIIFFNRKKLQLEGDELAQFVLHNMLAEPKSEKFHYLSLTVNSVILNTQQVFRSEYSNIPYFVKPEHALIALNYSIEGKPKAACFNSCPE